MAVKVLDLGQGEKDRINYRRLYGDTEQKQYSKYNLSLAVITGLCAASIRLSNTLLYRKD